MMKNIIYYSVLLVALIFSSCSNDNYLVDGGISDPNIGTDTFSFLQEHSQLDTLAILIERADLVDEVNGENTLFAPNNLSIKNYINTILSDLRQIDPEAEYTINDIPKDTLDKYLGGYIFPGKITRDDMSEQGDILTALNSEERRISLEPVDQYTGNLSEYPEYVFYTYKVGEEWDVWNAIDDDIKIQVRTSNLLSTNGVIHVLQGSHTLFNYRSPNSN